MIKHKEKINYQTYLKWQVDRAKRKWGLEPTTIKKRSKEFDEVWENIKDFVTF